MEFLFRFWKRIKWTRLRFAVGKVQHLALVVHHLEILAFVSVPLLSHEVVAPLLRREPWILSVQEALHVVHSFIQLVLSGRLQAVPEHQPGGCAEQQPRCCEEDEIQQRQSNSDRQLPHPCARQVAVSVQFELRIEYPTPRVV